MSDIDKLFHYKLYGVWDDKEGLYYETLADTPEEASDNISPTRDGRAVISKALRGEALIREVTVYVGTPVAAAAKWKVPSGGGGSGGAAGGPGSMVVADDNDGSIFPPQGFVADESSQ